MKNILETKLEILSFFILLFRKMNRKDVCVNIWLSEENVFYLSF